MQDCDDERSAWRKSSCSNPDSCVEVRFVENAIQVRDSKNQDGPVLTFTEREWAAFVDGVKRDEFDGVR
jgi:hypothetical protein